MLIATNRKKLREEKKKKLLNKNLKKMFIDFFLQFVNKKYFLINQKKKIQKNLIKREIFDDPDSDLELLFLLI